MTGRIGTWTRAAVGRATAAGAMLLASVVAAGAAGPLVKTDKGDVRGFVQEDVARFYGIPYAKPPVGKLRWKPPVEADAWKTTLDAVSFGPQCLQVTTLGPFAGPQNTNEDCLYLNVYAPLTALGGTKLPVIVWIHGGGNVDGASDAYDGSKMARDGKTIVVTLNYRLNLMGFLAHPAIQAEGELFGNYGIMDQQAVLRWVQANIGAFGGDRKNVTLGGQSAGSSDTMANMTSPLSAGLFHRAILQSGVGSTTPLATAETNAKNMAVAAGCGSGVDEATAKCLRNLPAEAVFKLAGTQSANGPYISGLIEDGTIIQRRFVDTLASGVFNKMPVMSGATIDEATFGLGITQYFRPGRTPFTEADYDAKIATYGAATFPADAQRRVKRLYPLSKYESPLLALDAIQSDTTQCTQHNTNVLLSDQVPVYAYQFADRTAPTLLPKDARLPVARLSHSRHPVPVHRLARRRPGHPARPQQAAAEALRRTGCRLDQLRLERQSERFRQQPMAALPGQEEPSRRARTEHPVLDRHHRRGVRRPAQVRPLGLDPELSPNEDCIELRSERDFSGRRRRLATATYSNGILSPCWNQKDSCQAIIA
ncbi:carboxylesterase family protein [Chenggangzhangella methanolivorans]|uniref:Carboxylic ester hydrolase n=1 Tax=Chenggangzhangella methanolivorans TaxID=1437009 RepID=A0A9E6RA98_9HYPH|nr:carboxylesterase family protein [Chenggangzhangella methanolivorans]UTI67635.1 CHL1-pnbA [Chenggangzhangella methanolivorans]